ncbi:MAG TPA: STAUR_1299 family protein [Myxococcaceae bacterium]|jgi:hypothetical protein
MTDTEIFLRLAFDRAPAAEANSAIARVREAREERSYEVILPKAEVTTFLLRTMLPKLVEHLESVGAKLPGCGGVFLSVFSGDTLYFLSAREAVHLLAEWSGLSVEQLKYRYRPR